MWRADQEVPAALQPACGEAAKCGERGRELGRGAGGAGRPEAPGRRGEGGPGGPPRPACVPPRPRAVLCMPSLVTVVHGIR